MTIRTDAIVIAAIPYGDTSKIVKCYTRETGIKSFITKGVYSKKNKINPILSPLNSIEIVYDDHKKGNLYHFKEARQKQIYHHLYTDPYKSVMLLFLSEILNQVLKEEEANYPLFDFILSSLYRLDLQNHSFSEFHLWFLIELTKYIGCYPNLTSNSNYFDLQNGVSTETITSHFCIKENELLLFEKLIQIGPFENSALITNRIQRKSILSILMKYYSLHLVDFRPPKSLEVLSVIFD